MPHDVDPLHVYYDGDCPRCRRFAARNARARAVTLIDLDTGAAALRAAGVSETEALRRIHAIDESGRVLAGIDAVAAVWRRRAGLRPLAWLIGLPGFHALAARLYDAIAARRARPG